MLAASRAINPEIEHIRGDNAHGASGTTFDAVFRPRSSDVL